MLRTYEQPFRYRCHTSRLLSAIILACCLTGLFLLTAASITTQTAYAAGPTVTLSLAGNAQATAPTGHPGTRVSIHGDGFTLGIINLYTTTSSDPAQCTRNANGLQPFTGHTTITTSTAGTFQFNASWPDNANAAGTAYYICALPLLQTSTAAVSSTAFTVAPAVTMSLSQTTANAGDQITVTGANWLPPQNLTLKMLDPNNGDNVIATAKATADNQGNFSSTLSIPANTASGSYTILVFADNEATPAMTLRKDNAITVNATAPTPTPTPTATPAATPSPTATATSTPAATPSPTAQSGPPGNGGNSGGGTTPTTLLIFGMGGLGILLLIIGGVTFAVYSRNS